MKKKVIVPGFLDKLDSCKRQSKMETKIFNFQAALKSKQAKRPIKAVEFPQDEHSDLFYPEMGEQRNPTKPILGEYIYTACNIRWKEDDDTTVRALLKKYRIRPKYEGIKHIPYGDPGGVVVMERKITLAPEALLRLNSALTF